MSNYQVINSSSANLPIVSIAMLTYNHENYIPEAIESVLMQKTDFPFQLVIAEDFSTDNTRKIVIDYQKKYPQKIKLILQNKNVGASKNNTALFENLKGKYIAALEGDDYWTDPLKLQKQVDFLEANEDFSICFHNVEEVNIDGVIFEKRLVQSSEEEKTYTIEDLSKGNFIHTASVVFRNNIKELPEFIKFSPMGDYPLHMINAKFGLIKYFPKKMAVYKFGGGLWSSQTVNNQILNTIFGIRLMRTYFSEYKNVVKNFDDQLYRLLSNLEKNILSKKPSDIEAEKIAYNLSFKKLVIIILKKLKHNLQNK